MDDLDHRIETEDRDRVVEPQVEAEGPAFRVDRVGDVTDRQSPGQVVPGAAGGFVEFDLPNLSDAFLNVGAMNPSVQKFQKCTP